MRCERLKTLIKNWYIQVQEEAMAPARMVEFMGLHITKCEDCLEDPDVKSEVGKIKEIVLPPSKISKSQEANESDVEEEDATDSNERENESEDEYANSDDSDDDESEIEGDIDLV